ncbi:hypothetical protein SDC9_212093 [bioreactor metagenome]|uniref:Uncharacterized protein n=1 Tax=bioreactor metagenome TaxID=1076179 RepID=A0A645JL51_9ZZZZ
MKVLSHLNADEAAAHYNSAAGLVLFNIFLYSVSIRNVAQRKHPVGIAAGNGRAHRLGSH